MNATIRPFESEILNEQWYILRAMFYVLTPNETHIQKVEDVPDIPVKASNMFFLLIFIEQIVFLIKKRRITFRTNDGIVSVSAGVISALPNFLLRDIQVLTFEWIYNRYLIYEIPFDSAWAYILSFLFIDMMYYWFHRAAHEINIFWASHQTHHSSEEYNLTSALRQSVFQTYISWAFYLPLALFVRPSIFLIHSHMNLVYQFWIHTNAIDNIGPLEYILNTPSHHRVHHGRNPYCIDKNYAGVLIIWDRIFGTFEAEKKDEELAYGLVHPIKTFDPIYIQIFHFKFILKKAWKADSWSKKFGILFKGPGWQPGTGRLGDRNALPKVKYPIKPFNVEISKWLNFYVAFHFALVMIAFTSFANFSSEFPVYLTSAGIFFILFSLTSFGYIFDAKPKCFLVEWIRCSMLWALHFYNESFFVTYIFSASSLLNTVFKTSLMLSVTVMGFFLVKNIQLLKEDLTKPKKTATTTAKKPAVTATATEAKEIKSD